MPRLLCVAWLLVCGLLCACAEQKQEKAPEVPYVAGSALGYSYRLLVPDFYKRSLQPNLPVIVAMHGTGGSANDALLAWQKIAQEYGVFVLAPEYYDNAEIFTQASDDAVFAMLAQVEQTYAIDRRRRYITGFSTGGTWAFLFALTYSDYFPSATVFAGGYTGDNASVVNSAPRPISMVLVHGTNDPVLPIANARDANTALENHNHDTRLREHGRGHSVPSEELEFAWSFMQLQLLPTAPAK